MNTFRTSRVNYGLIAVLFLISAAFVWASVVAPSPRPLELNEIPIHPDDKAAAVPIAFVFGFLGLFFLGWHHFRRVEIDDTGIRIFGPFNLLRFDAPWDRIDQMSLAPDWNGNSSFQSWVLQSAASRGRIPRALENYGELMRVIATSVPMAARPTSAIPPLRGNAANTQPFTHRGRTTRTLLLAAFGLVWCLSGLFGVLLIVTFAPVGAKWENNAVDFAQISAQFLLPIPFFVSAWFCFRPRWTSITKSGLEQDTGDGPQAIAWDEIVFSESRCYFDGPISNTELVVVSPWTTITIDASEPAYRPALEAVFALAPPTAVLAAPGRK